MVAQTELCSVAVGRVTLTDEAVNRAAYFKQNGLRDFDSLHLAVAEINRVDVFLTTDDKLLRAAHRLDVKSIKKASLLAACGAEARGFP